MVEARLEHLVGATLGIDFYTFPEEKEWEHAFLATAALTNLLIDVNGLHVFRVGLVLDIATVTVHKLFHGE